MPASDVVEVARRLLEAGCDEISIGDTIGVAVPTQVSELVDRLTEAVPVEKLAVHFHDTRGTALANVLAALQEGVTIVDSSAGGLGGCPYAPGASGNLATEDLIYMLQGMEIATGVDLAAVVGASRAVSQHLGRQLPSRYLAAGQDPGREQKASVGPGRRRPASKRRADGEAPSRNRGSTSSPRPAAPRPSRCWNGTWWTSSSSTS